MDQVDIGAVLDLGRGARIRRTARPGWPRKDLASNGFRCPWETSRRPAGPCGRRETRRSPSRSSATASPERRRTAFPATANIRTSARARRHEQAEQIAAGSTMSRHSGGPALVAGSRYPSSAAIIARAARPSARAARTLLSAFFPGELEPGHHLRRARGLRRVIGAGATDPAGARRRAWVWAVLLARSCLPGELRARRRLRREASPASSPAPSFSCGPQLHARQVTPRPPRPECPGRRADLYGARMRALGTACGC